MLRIAHANLYRTDLTTRFPFRYGIATMTQMPLVFLQVHLELDGRLFPGVASDILPPKWFTKEPEKSPLAEIEEMLAVILRAANRAQGLAGRNPFMLWRQLYEDQAAWARRASIPLLLANFGVTLVERAMIDAFCRSHQQPFWQLLREGIMGVEPGEIHPELKNISLREFLPSAPLAQVLARHTIGLADPCTDADVAPAERLMDRLPQSLEDCIRTYNLRHFKIKVSGQLTPDLVRLERIAAVLQAHAPPDFAFTLDGNEQFQTGAAFREYWVALQAHAPLEKLWPHLLFVEQPLHRAVALDPLVGEELRAWTGHPPVIIDESDAELESLPQALALGYSGTSHKNCKGVFKSVIARSLLQHRNQGRTGQPLILSAEDLCNVGPIAVIQDLAVAAALGIESIERNGHHYVAGLSQLPPTVQQQVLESHPDLYRRHPAGWPTLHVQAGRLSLESINRAPFGYGFSLNVEPFALATIPKRLQHYLR